MELVDEAHLDAPHARALSVAEARAVRPIDDDAPTVRRLQQTGYVQQRRLARTRWAPQCDGLPGIELGRGAPEHRDLPVALAEGARKFHQLQYGAGGDVLHCLTPRRTLGSFVAQRLDGIEPRGPPGGV